MDTLSSNPSHFFIEHKDKKNLFVIPEYSFAVELLNENIKLSNEHSNYSFLTYEECSKILEFDSNKRALYELNERIVRENYNQIK